MKKYYAALAFSLIVTTSASAEERAIDEKITVKANIDDVWKAWTTSEGIKTFFAPDAKVELRVDGPFQIYINPYAEPGLKGADDMRIIGFQDKKMLSLDRKSTRLNSSHPRLSRMPSSA